MTSAAQGGLQLLSSVEFVSIALLTMRVTALVWSAPMFSSQVIPQHLKAAITVLLVVILRPIAVASAPEDLTLTITAILAELSVGLALGLGAAIFTGAAEAAGDLLSVQMGLSGANVVDPMSRTQIPILGQFLGICALTMILATGGHLVILRTFAVSLDVVPVGSRLDFSAGIFVIVRLGGHLLWLGLQFAAPVVAAVMVGNVGLGIMARTVPQLNVLMVAFPLQIGIGLFVLAATIPIIATSFARWNEQYGDLANDLLGGLAPLVGGP